MLSEFEIIERYFLKEAGTGVVVGIGDDAAVVDESGLLVVAVDTLVGGVHFPPDSPPRSIGHRALAVNLSDLAAMGAMPSYATLALTLPAADAAWLEEFAAGFFELAARFDVDLIGGDTTRGPLSVTVQVLGRAVDEHVLTRAGGHVGDDVYVTGTLGDGAAAIALHARSTESREAAELFRRFSYPEPRIREGLALRTLASAAIDVSDGLVADLGHLCRQSGCGARIEVERLPLSAELEAAVSGERAVDFALTGGDDYELCFTAPAARAEAVAAVSEDRGVPITRIGALVAGEGVVCYRNGEPMPKALAGYTHF